VPCNRLCNRKIIQRFGLEDLRLRLENLRKLGLGHDSVKPLQLVSLVFYTKQSDSDFVSLSLLYNKGEFKAPVLHADFRSAALLENAIFAFC